MALDFGDAGLFDPLPDKDKEKKIKPELGADDENENVHGNGWNNDDHEKKDDGDDQDEDPADIEEEEDWPTAPPLDILDCIKGYEMVSFDATSVPPPPFDEAVASALTNGGAGEDGNEEEGDTGDGKEDESGGEIKAKVGKVLILLTSIQYLSTAAGSKRKASDAGHVCSRARLALLSLHCSLGPR